MGQRGKSSLQRVLTILLLAENGCLESDLPSYETVPTSCSVLIVLINKLLAWIAGSVASNQELPALRSVDFYTHYSAGHHPPVSFNDFF